MEISIVGGGIGGLTTAIALQKKGFEVRVFEKASEILPVGAGLSLSVNAIKALKEIGIADQIIEYSKPIKSFPLLDKRGNLISQRDLSAGEYGSGNFAIHRATLQSILIKQLKPCTLILGKTFKSFDVQNDSVQVEFEGGFKVKTDFLIGADGIHSRVRNILLPGVTPRFAGYTSWRAVIKSEPFIIQNSEFSETWAPEGRFGIVPLAGNKIYWFACINSKLNDEYFKAFKVSDLISVFKNFHPTVKEILELTNDSDLIHNDILSLPPLSQFAFGKVLILGDAAHATTPNLAQGACQAIEDAVVLSKCLLKYPDNGEKAFMKFQDLRLKRTRKIAKLSSTLGKVAQLENPFLCKVRDQVFKMIPASVSKKQMDFLFNIDFSVNK